jgi:hypothetical protein
METTENLGNLNPVINTIQKRKRKKTSYKKINNQTRQKLIEMVIKIY